MKKFLLLLVAASTLFGCSTDVDINAPYKEITVVYALLNQRDSIHFVKINKAFLGEGDAFVYAQIQDSSEYHNEEISRKMIYRLNTTGQRVDSFPLRDTLITTREPGTFYAPEQRMYYFTGPGYPNNPSQFIAYLEPDSDYELDLVVKGEQIRAVTNVVNDFTISSVNISPTTDVNFYGTQGYIPYTFRWSSGRDGKRYQLSWRFNYYEVRNDGDTIHRNITQRMATRVASNSSNIGESMESIYEGEQFFSVLAGRIAPDPAVERRVFTGMDFLMAVANDEFHITLALSEPISGIIEERPAYSNVENGYGVFASRYTKTVENKKLGGATRNELINGPYTGPLNFCWLDDVGTEICD